MGFLAPDPPQAPQEDPAIKAERDRAQKRANDDRLRSLQDQLRTEDNVRGQRFGTASLLGPLANPAALARRGLRQLFGTG